MEKQYVISKISGVFFLAITVASNSFSPGKCTLVGKLTHLCLSVWVSRTSIEISLCLIVNILELSLPDKTRWLFQKYWWGDSLPLCRKLSLRHRAGRGLWVFWVYGATGWVGQAFCFYKTYLGGQISHRKCLAFLHSHSQITFRQTPDQNDFLRCKLYQLGIFKSHLFLDTPATVVCERIFAPDFPGVTWRNIADQAGSLHWGWRWGLSVLRRHLFSLSHAFFQFHSFFHSSFSYFF